MANQVLPSFQTIKRHWKAEQRARDNAAQPLRSLELEIPAFPRVEPATEDGQRERLRAVEAR